MIRLHPASLHARMHSGQGRLADEEAARLGAGAFPSGGGEAPNSGRFPTRDSGMSPQAVHDGVSWITAGPICQIPPPPGQTIAGFPSTFAPARKHQPKPGGHKGYIASVYTPVLEGPGPAAY